MTTKQLQESVKIPYVFKELCSFFKEQETEYLFEHFLGWVRDVSIKFDNHVKVPVIPVKGLENGVDVVKMIYDKNTESFKCVGSRYFISWTKAQTIKSKVFQSGMNLLATMAHRRIKKSLICLKLFGPKYLLQVFKDQQPGILLTTPFHQSNYAGNSNSFLIQDCEDEKVQGLCSFDIATGNFCGLNKSFRQLVVEFVKKQITDYYNTDAWETSFEDVEEIKAFKMENDVLAANYGLKILTFHDGDFPERFRRKVTVVKNE